ncbi:hypothetical protein BEN48_10340 [Hymenobacter glacialis]|uniref:Uncharacterized protein n=1 Tax=Hymenobacter glacialis TaxID=1908236 RepID=A0A1G1TBG2_9BACT|nr:hypothetical protein BEN48_10340 [Hymenobacter glacialis]
MLSTTTGVVTNCPLGESSMKTVAGVLLTTRNLMSNSSPTHVLKRSGSTTGKTRLIRWVIVFCHGSTWDQDMLKVARHGYSM